MPKFNTRCLICVTDPKKERGRKYLSNPSGSRILGTQERTCDLKQGNALQFRNVRDAGEYIKTSHNFIKFSQKRFLCAPWIHEVEIEDKTFVDARAKKWD